MALTIWSGLTLGAVYAMVALGSRSACCPSGVFNFAQGAIVVAGTFLAYQLLRQSTGLALIPALLVNLRDRDGLGIACELLAVRPLRSRRPVAHAAERARDDGRHVDSDRGRHRHQVGLSAASGSVPRADRRSFTSSASRRQPVEIAAGRPSGSSFAVGLHFWFHLTRCGQACLAVAEDREAATLRGINVNLLSLGGFAAAGALGTVSAFAIGPDHLRDPDARRTRSRSAASSRSRSAAQAASSAACSAGLLVGLVSAFATRYLGANYADICSPRAAPRDAVLRPHGPRRQRRRRAVSDAVTLRPRPPRRRSTRPPRWPRWRRFLAQTLVGGPIALRSRSSARCCCSSSRS